MGSDCWTCSDGQRTIGQISHHANAEMPKYCLATGVIHQIVTLLDVQRIEFDQTAFIASELAITVLNGASTLPRKDKNYRATCSPLNSLISY